MKNKYNTEIEIVKGNKVYLFGSIIFLLTGIILTTFLYYVIDLYIGNIVAFFLALAVVLSCFVFSFELFNEYIEKKEVYKIPARKVRNK